MENNWANNFVLYSSLTRKMSDRKYILRDNKKKKTISERYIGGK